MNNLQQQLDHRDRIIEALKKLCKDAYHEGMHGKYPNVTWPESDSHNKMNNIERTTA